MEVKFNVTKDERKALVAAVSEITGCKAKYQGAPSFAYAVGDYTVDKNGMLIHGEEGNVSELRSLLTGLTECGFVFEGNIDKIAPAGSMAVETEPCSLASDDGSSARASLPEAPSRLVIEVPLEGFTQTALDNLSKLVDGKSALIMKAIGIDQGDGGLPIKQTESTLRFAWFKSDALPEEIDAYTRLVCALCDMAKKQKRVTLTESNVDSEKYAFRCFLLRLGFIGKEYASARKILLSRLSGNSSFKRGKSP